MKNATKKGMEQMQKAANARTKAKRERNRTTAHSTVVLTARHTACRPGLLHRPLRLSFAYRRPWPFTVLIDHVAEEIRVMSRRISLNQLAFDIL